MEIIFIKNSDIADFKEALEMMVSKAKSLMILSSEKNDYNVLEVNALLSSYTIPIIGGIFPQIIYKNQTYIEGTLIISIDDVLEIAYLENLSSRSLESLDSEIEECLGVLSADIKSMFVFVDGLSKNINDVILALFENYGLTINYIGGGAGSLSFEQKPVLFSNRGLLEDAAVLAVTKQESAIGVKHGWNPISDSLKVTAEANKITELDYKPALEVYKEVVEALCGKKITKENFFDIAKAYPLGINKLSGEMVVRDPIMIEDNALICVGDIATNSFVSILHGNHDSLINAANEAKEEAALEQEHFTLFIDCISRALFLKESFNDELSAVYHDNTILVGALTLGEIANNKKHYLEFYNKTAVIANIEIDV
jgi:hypothetical protein